MSCRGFCGAGLPCLLGIAHCFPNILIALPDDSGSGALGGKLRHSRSSFLSNRYNHFVLF